MTYLRALFVSMLLTLVLSQSVWAQQGNCGMPGDILDVPTPGFLRNEPADLRLRIDGNLSPVTLVSQTTSRLRIRLPLTGLPYSTQFKVVHIEKNGSQKVVANARVCDDPNPGSGGGGTGGGGTGGGSTGGGGTGGGNSGGGASGGGTGGSFITGTLGSGSFLRNGRSRPLIRATRNEVAAPSGEPEYLLIGRGEQMARAQILLSRRGVSILRSSSLGALGVRLAAVDLNGQMNLSQARAILAQERITVTMDTHSVYRAAAGRRVYANSLLGLPPASGCQLPKTIRVGLIDGPVDTGNPALSGVTVLSKSVLNASERIGSANHATGIAALISSNGTGNLPQGVSPGTQLFSVVAFARNGGRDVARLENIAEALDWMISRKVHIVNMSLAGPMNDTLEDIIKIAEREGLIMVAATGNGARGKVSYPASDPRVLAVTAVDASGRNYRRANFGPEVDFAAPGVDLLLPHNRGTAYRSGTSYAAAIATAVIAQELARKPASRKQLIDTLRKRAKDLGEPGKDARFGWGLLQAGPC